MDRKFLEELAVGEQALPQEAVDAILAEHDRAMAALQFQQTVENTIIAAGGRSVKAISALLDLPALRESGDPAALHKAVQALKKDSAYLFSTPTPPPYAAGTGTAQVERPAPQTLAGALREKFQR